MAIESFPPNPDTGKTFIDTGNILLEKVTDFSELLANGYNPKEYSEMYISGEDAKATQYLLIKEGGEEISIKILKTTGMANTYNNRTGGEGFGVFKK